MTTQELKQTVKELKGYNVISVNFKENTFTTEKCVYSFELTKKGLLKHNSIHFLFSISSYENCTY